MDLFLKRLIKKQFKRKQKNHSAVYYLPSHILAIILKNLDFATLVSNQDEFADALPEISSFSSSLPSSLLLPQRSTLWYGKILNYIFKHVLIFFDTRENLPCSEKLFDFGYKTLLWLHMPRIRPSGLSLFQKFTGLESLEVEYRAASSANDSLTFFSNPGTWLRWDLKLGSSKPNHDYALYVLGDIVSPQGTEVVQEESPELKYLRRRWTISCHGLSQLPLLWSIIRNGVKEVVIKDPEKRGKTILGPEFLYRYSFLLRGCRMIIYNLPSVIHVSSSNNSSLLIKDTWLCFAIDDYKRLEEDENDNASIDECIRSCLGGIDVEEDEKRELREVVTKILDDENREIEFRYSAVK